MPRGDGTGPAGFGSMTGRAAGFCAGYSVPGFMNPVGRFRIRSAGYGLGLGFGRGRGWRSYANRAPYRVRGYYPFDPAAVYPAAEDEQKYEDEVLAQDAKILKEQLKQIEARLEELKKDEEEGKD
jgi:hypothetical protein